MKALEFNSYTIRPLIPAPLIEELEITELDIIKYAMETADECLTPEEMKIRESSFLPDFKIIRDVTYIDIRKLKPLPDDINYFPPANEGERNMMVASIEQNGFLSPIIVWEDKNSKRDYIVTGGTRIEACKILYHNTKDEKYLKVPCYYLKQDEVDFYKIKCIVIDSNLAYRNIPLHIKIYAIIERYELMKMSKKYRNEINIAEEISKSYNMSRSSVFNYIKLKGLCPKFRKLLAEGRLKFKSALTLSNCSHEYQEKLLKEYGLKPLNDKSVIRTIGQRTMRDSEREVGYKLLMKGRNVTHVNFNVSCNRDYAYMVFEAMKDIRLEIVKDKMGQFLNSDFRFHATEDIRNLDNMDVIEECNDILLEKDVDALKEVLKPHGEEVRTKRSKTHEVVIGEGEESDAIDRLKNMTQFKNIMNKKSEEKLE